MPSGYGGSSTQSCQPHTSSTHVCKTNHILDYHGFYPAPGNKCSLKSFELSRSMIKTTVAGWSSKHTSNFIISTDGYRAEANCLCIFSCSDCLNSRNGWVNVDIVLVVFSCRQSWTVNCEEAFCQQFMAPHHGCMCVSPHDVSVGVFPSICPLAGPFSCRESATVLRTF